MKRVHKYLLTALMLTLLFAAIPISATSAVAEEQQQRVVRVGWYEYPFNKTDKLDRRSGYAYEYQQKIAAYSGWKYQYVNGSWSELLQMLAEGKIDLLSDISLTEERANNMLFSSLAMGSEEYYIFIAVDNNEISIDNFSTFNGKKVGINKGSVMIDMFRSWAETNNVTAEIVELTESNDEALSMLQEGTIDMCVTLASFFDSDSAIPVCQIGSSDFYFAVNKNYPEVLEELNAAMNRIHRENPYYNQQMYFKYLSTIATNFYLSADELKWLSTHGAIRVGYQDNYLAFCAKDPGTGKLTGALKDYLEIAADCIKNAHLEFETIAYPTADAAMKALKNGEVDCMFPANLSDYDGEEQGLFMTSPLMCTDISAIVLESEQKAFINNDHVIVAVNAGNPNYDKFLLDHFPEWRSVKFNDTAECLKAVSEGKADCLLISNYRFNNISKLCKKYDLIQMSTGVEMDYCFAVARDGNILYSILNKVNDLVPSSTINAALSYYYTEDAKETFEELMQENIAIVIPVVVIITIVILALVFYIIQTKKKTKGIRQLVKATETDVLTGLYNKSYFFEYANRLYKESPDKPMDAIAINIEQFHTVNALNGREFGDQILRELGSEMLYFLQQNGGIACHIEADHFFMYCTHVGDLSMLFDRLQSRLDAVSHNITIVRLRMGVMQWQKGIEPQQMFENAQIACGKARGNYKERIIIIDESIHEQESREHRLINDLQGAVDNGELMVYYQPQYDIGSEGPVLCGAEALIRWDHPELGQVSPGEFIPLFEKNGQIDIVDTFVRETVARQIIRWKDAYGIVVPVSVNISRAEILDPMLESSLDALYEKNGLKHSEMPLEVTESAYIENADRFIEVIEHLRENGYMIVMDDFGSGYSSLNMLSTMPIDVLKIDRAFIRDIERSKKNEQLVKLILDIAKKLKVSTVAEGVETKTQFDLLKRLGCPTVQGFYFSRPVPAEEFERNILDKMSSN